MRQQHCKKTWKERSHCWPLDTIAAILTRLRYRDSFRMYFRARKKRPMRWTSMQRLSTTRTKVPLGFRVAIAHWPSETIGAILKQRGIGFILAFSRKSQPRKKIDAAIANIIKNNDRVFIDGLITTTKSVHVYDPENSFGKAAKNHMKFVPRVNDHGRHSAACILGCVHDAAFFQSPTAYNGSRQIFFL